MNIGYKIYFLVWVFQNILKLVRKMECKYTCKNERGNIFDLLHGFQIRFASRKDYRASSPIA